MESHELLSLKLRLARQGLNLTQQDVAKKIGVSLRTLQRVESGQTPIDVGTMYQFCENLGIDFLSLTKPDLTPEEVTNCDFFETEEEFLKHPKVNSNKMLELKNSLLLNDKETIQDIISRPKRAAAFFETKTPLLIVDPQTTFANPQVNKLSPLYREAKWKTGAKFHKPFPFVNAWDICLRLGFKGFRVSNLIDIEKKINLEKFYLMINPNPNNPLAICQVV